MRKLVKVLCLVMLVSGTYFLGVHKTAPKVLSTTAKEPLGIFTLWQDSNLERTKIGLQPLVLSTQLDVSAQNKCLDMEQKNYWAHNAPDGTEPWSFIKAQTTYQKAGENLEYGSTTSSGVTKNWMDSPGHKDNILNSSFMNVGYAICDFRGTKLVVQHFTG